MMAAIQNAAYSQFHAFETPSRTPAEWGYPLQQGYLNFQGIPVLGDPFSVQYTQVTSESLAGSGATYTFAKRYPCITPPIGGTDFAGNAVVAPVLKVSGTTVSNYSINVSQDGIGTVTFTSAPSATPVRAYAYENHHVFLLSLNDEDIILPVSKEIEVEEIAPPFTQDLRQFRVKGYQALAVRNPYAHSVALNVYAPPVGGSF